MTDDEISAAAELWVRDGAIDVPRDEIEWALRQLPTPAACALSDDATALLVLGMTDTLFMVFADAEGVRLTSRPLAAERLIVGLQWGRRTALSDTLESRATQWSFRQEGEGEPQEPWQRMSGSVSIDRDTGREHLDARERFARALAMRAGWSGQAPRVIDEEPPAAATDDAEQGESRWRAMTDVWGRPLGTRRP